MAEDFESRTEPASPRRREEARQQGQVAVSQELIGALVLLAGLAVLALQGRALGGGLLDALRVDLPRLPSADLSIEAASALLAVQFERCLRLLGLFLGVLLATGLGASLFQVGFHVNPEVLSFKFEKLSPAQGATRLFSTAALVRGALSLVKVAGLVFLTVWLLRGRTGLVASLGQAGVGYAAVQGWGLVARVCLGVTGVLVLLGAIDYAYQRFRFERTLRMTRQEVKQELKNEEGDPLIRNRIRQLQREMARRRMMAAVPKAAVVVTNPTHLAVALRYERVRMKAPRVVAKGAGHVAARIVALARAHGVPIVEREPVARALYRAVKLDQEIPGSLFYAMAEVLAYVYRLRGIVPAASRPAGK
jgi:flagellar biosynthetic protein FlhB